MDIPNSRSAHVAPTPKSGGVAIVMTFCLGCIVIFTVAERIVIRQAYFHGFLFSALLIAIVSLYDDIKNKPFVFKLVTQFVAVGVVLASGLLVDQIALPVVGLVGLGWLSLPVSFLSV
jgi:UDP-N-acetylmuramyl pentapeptide phosphotransferase/UDP-N-acetylglucosamine-1-phosphate transferase